MIALQQCDIELVDDRVFCYAPLLDARQLAYFRKLCLTLHAKLNDNLKLRVFPQRKTRNPFRHRIPGNPARYLGPIIGISFASLTAYLTSIRPPDPDALHNNDVFFAVAAAILLLVAVALVGLMVEEYARIRSITRRNAGRYRDHSPGSSGLLRDRETPQGVVDPDTQDGQSLKQILRYLETHVPEKANKKEAERYLALMKQLADEVVGETPEFNDLLQNAIEAAKSGSKEDATKDIGPNRRSQG